MPPVIVSGGPRLGEQSKSSVEIVSFSWTGEVPPQKWMNFYTKVPSRFATVSGLNLTLTIDFASLDGMLAFRGTAAGVWLRCTARIARNLRVWHAVRCLLGPLSSYELVISQ